jgi:hypothetical protein
MKLTPENITFIDNYLKNSEVIYYDIRMEMLDHVATAVEQKMNAEHLEFYDAFKSYIMVHKKEILKGNKEEGLHFKEPLKKFCLFAIQPFQVLLALIISFAVYMFTIKVGFTNSNEYFFICILVAYITFGICHFLIHKNKKYYYIDKNFSILFILFQAGNLFYKCVYENLTSSVIFNSVILFVFIVFLKYYYQEMRNFKQRNQFLLL